MYHVVFVLLSVSVLGMGWLLVHAAPPLVARILPKTLTFIVGSCLALLGAFGGFMDAYYLRDASAVIGTFVMIVIGVWFMLAPSANARGTWRDQQMMKRIFVMLGFVFAVIVLAFYLPHYRAVAIFNLLMVTGSLWVTTNYFRQVDSGR